MHREVAASAAASSARTTPTPSPATTRSASPQPYGPGRGGAARVRPGRRGPRKRALGAEPSPQTLAARQATAHAWVGSAGTPSPQAVRDGPRRPRTRHGPLTTPTPSAVGTAWPSPSAGWGGPRNPGCWPGKSPTPAPACSARHTPTPSRPATKWRAPWAGWAAGRRSLATLPGRRPGPCRRPRRRPPRHLRRPLRGRHQPRPARPLTRRPWSCTAPGRRPHPDRRSGRPETLRARHGLGVNSGGWAAGRRRSPRRATSAPSSGTRPGPRPPRHGHQPPEVAAGLGSLGRWSEALVAYRQVAERAPGRAGPTTFGHARGRGDEAHCLERLAQA